MLYYIVVSYNVHKLASYIDLIHYQTAIMDIAMRISRCDSPSESVVTLTIDI